MDDDGSYGEWRGLQPPGRAPRVRAVQQRGTTGAGRVGLVLVLLAVPVVAIGGVLVLALVAGLGVWAVIVADDRLALPVTATVQERSWVRTTEIEQLKLVHREAWCDDVPGGARVTHEETRTTPPPAAGRIPRSRSHWGHSSHHRDAPAPKPRQWCAYDLEDWVALEPRVASGPPEVERTWAEVPAPCAALGCTRVTDQSERLLVTLALPDRVSECDVDEALWTAASSGATVEVPVGRVFGGVRCDRARLAGPPES